MNRIILCFFVFLCLSSTHAFAAKDATQKSFDHFQLFISCERFALLVEELSAEALKIGLTKESIQNAVESRLRSARIFSPMRIVNNYLYVNVHVGGRAFAIMLQFNKRVFDTYTGTKGQATTWETGGSGTHGNRPDLILSALSQLIDEFLTKFLRVNDKACRKRHKDSK